MRVPLPALLLALLATLAGSAPVQAHGAVNAGELETLMVKDEASDVVTGLEYGYDLVDLYVGEAWLPGLGDGFYVHTILFGGAGDRPIVDGPQTVTFRFEFGSEVVERSMTTTDGATFKSDFDDLSFVVGDGEVEVQRAFVAYPDGIGAGSVLTRLQAQSFVNGEPRDIAPGGVFPPGGATAVTLPMEESSQLIESYTLMGPVGYVRAEIVPMSDGSFFVTGWSLLKEGEQHILMPTPEATGGWLAQVEGGGETKAGGAAYFTVRLTPGQGPLQLDLNTDIGGHVALVAEPTPEGIRLSAPDHVVMQVTEESKEAPWPASLLILALAAVLLLRRVKG